MRYLTLAVLLLALGGCGMLPSLSLTPVSADIQAGGVRETGNAEDNMAKVEVGSTNTSNKITADTVSQIENNIQEYPKWLIIAFAVALGLAIPSPLSAWQSWRRRRYLEKQIDFLTKQLYASQPTSTTKPVEKVSVAEAPLPTSRSTAYGTAGGPLTSAQ